MTVAEIEDKLLPCPFCGRKGKVVHVGRPGWMRTEIACVNRECHAKPVVHAAYERDVSLEVQQQDTIDYWNERS